MEVKIWGARGSAPVASPDFSHYGGDTACIEVLSNSGDALLLDAGSGLGAYERALDGALRPSPPILLTHLHMDHIQGLPFYSPLYDAKNAPVIYGPRFSPDRTLKEELGRLFDGILMPVKIVDLPATDMRGLKPGDAFKIGSFLIETARTNHPGEALAYKITADGWTFVYTGDHEIPLDEQDQDKVALNKALLDFIGGADVVLADCQFDREEHLKRPGWGHSHFEQWLPEISSRGAKSAVLMHYSPRYDDAKVASMLAKAREKAGSLIVSAARPGMRIGAGGVIAEPKDRRACPNCGFYKKLGAFSDARAVFSALLTEARRRAKCDAGAIYLVENDELSFSASQNDTLFPDSAANKFAYMTARLPINGDSVAGYVAREKKILNIADAYAIDDSAPYSFNSSFDEKTGYRTRSLLVVPLVNARGKAIGVLQLINALDNGRPAPFGEEIEKTVYELCSIATVPIERSLLVTDMILRALRTTASRDPNETGRHVRRVGSVAAELYHRWALEHGADPEELIAEKGKIRLAAMLHDVGKVWIPDKILKKPGKLDNEERALMQEHAALGAGLFDDAFNEIEVMARDIALHHHARWDGKGYTGSKDIVSPSGPEIPLAARITAIADVYDALVSKRCYKDSWDPSKALEILREESGKHFDPELVRLFMEIQDVTRPIYERYGDEKEE
ncbi:MAG: HD domain-containing protein [Desulfovibrio sp.]|nr:HD domain-containing protein [Desulfovibrio sp.]